MSSERLVVVGGGLAGSRAVEALREGGYDGSLVLIGNDPELPYDRPPLSKGVLAGSAEPEAALLHSREWYADQQVDLRVGTDATHLDVRGHTLTLEDHSEVGWDRLLLATGSTPRRLDVPGADLAHVVSLRTLKQSVTLRDRLRTGGGPVVIIGAGWIGLEVAAAARGHGCEVTVIEPHQTPLSRVVGPEVGQYFVDLHTSHGVRFRLGTSVQRLLGDRAVTGVVTTSGEQVRADTVVVGIGISPDTRLAEEAGLEVGDGIVCDASLRTSAPGVFAAGDVARWFHPTLQRHLRVDHWANAHHSGYVAGRSMLGEDVRHDALPSFFSDQYDIGLEYAGFVPPDVSTQLVLRGDPGENAFMAFWLHEGKVCAGMHVNTWDSIDGVKALIRSGVTVEASELADPHRSLDDLIP